jgi:hypothetical protein
MTVMRLLCLAFSKVEKRGDVNFLVAKTRPVIESSPSSRLRIRLRVIQRWGFE